MITEDAATRLKRAFNTLMREIPDHLIPLDSQVTSERELFEDIDVPCIAPDPWESVEPPTIDEYPW